MEGVSESQAEKAPEPGEGLVGAQFGGGRSWCETRGRPFLQGPPLPPDFSSEAETDRWFPDAGLVRKRLQRGCCSTTDVVRSQRAVERSDAFPLHSAATPLPLATVCPRGPCPNVVDHSPAPLPPPLPSDNRLHGLASVSLSLICFVCSSTWCLRIPHGERSHGVCLSLTRGAGWAQGPPELSPTAGFRHVLRPSDTPPCARGLSGNGPPMLV